MNKLTVVIIALNEEENIGRCLYSVRGVADEIVVVDSGSNDKTISIAEAQNARVIHRAFTNYIEQKNFAAEQATGEFVLNLDADEALSDALKNSIRTEKQNSFPAGAYSMNRLNFYCGRAIKTCSWYPDKKIRLWKKGKGNWEGKLVHEKMKLAEGVVVKHLEGDVLHNTYPTREAFIKQTENFAALAAEQMKSKNTLFLFLKMVFSPPAKFVSSYFLNLGFTEGANGFTICFYQSREVFLKYFLAIKWKRQ